MIYTITTQTKPEIVSNEYKDGSRIADIKVRFTEADDWRMASNLRNQMAMIVEQYANNRMTLEDYTVRREEIQSEIDEYEDYLNGYIVS